MTRRKVRFYDVLVYIAYGYFFLIGAGWFIVSLGATGFNYWAFGIMLIFGAQAYLRHRLTDLIIGLLVLGLSIFMLLQSFAIGKKGGFDGLANTLIATSAIAVVMSVIIMFSYVKVSFRDSE